MSTLMNDLNVSLITKLQGHEAAITSISFNPILGLKQIATASQDKSIMLCNIDNVRAYKFSGHKDQVLDVCFSPGGKLFASASLDKTVRLWCPDYKKDVSSTEFRAHSAAVRSVSFSPDGQKMITCSDDKTVKAWVVCKQKFLFSFNDHTNWVRCARISPDEKLLASASDDKSVRVYDLNSRVALAKFCDLKAAVLHAEFHPHSVYIAAAYTDGTVKLFDMRMRKLLQLYAEHEKKVQRLAFHPSGNILLSCSDDAKINAMDLREATKICSILDHKAAVLGLAFSKDGNYFASGGAEKHLFVFEHNLHELPSDCVDVPQDASLNIATTKPDAKEKSTQNIVNTETQTAFPSGPEEFVLHEHETDSSFCSIGNVNMESAAHHCNLHPVVDALVSEVDMLTQTLLMLEKRLSIAESKLQAMQQTSLPHNEGCNHHSHKQVPLSPHKE